MIDKNLEDKDIYKLFNEIQIEESEFNDMDEQVTAIQKERIKKNLNKKIKNKNTIKIFKYGSIAAAITLVSIIGIGTASPAFAENIPILKSITQTLNDTFGFHGDYAKYSQIINKGVTDKEVTLTINEVIADDSKLIIGYTIKSNKKIKDLEIFSLSQFLKINGKQFPSSGGFTGKYIDSHTYICTEEIHTSLPQSSKTFNIDLNIDDINGIKGKWNIAFTASKDELIKKSIIFKPNTQVNLPSSTITVNKITFSPIDTSIFISGNYKNGNSDATNPAVTNDYIVFDDKGVELISKGGSFGAGNIGDSKFNDELNFINQKHIPKYLTFIPCRITASAGGGVQEDKNGKETPIKMKTIKPKEISKIIDGVYPIELPQGKMGKLIIKDIKTKGDTTTVKFTAVGKAPYFQAESLWIKDDKGETLIPKNYDKHRNEQKPNEFALEFPALDSNKKYTIYTDDFSNVQFREDLKFNVILK